MGNMVAKFIDFGLRSLERRPMLTPMMMYAVGFGAAALIISLSVWRDASCSPNPQKFYPLYMVSHCIWYRLLRILPDETMRAA
jgi:putative ABC transport system permease protein